MKKILWISLILAGCATKPPILLSAPTMESFKLLKLQSEDSGTNRVKSESEEQYFQYMKAKNALQEKDLSLACDLFSGLVKANKLPFKELAALKQLDACSISNSEIDQMVETNNFSNYIREAFLNKLLELSIKQNYQLAEAKILFRLIDYKKTNSEKVSYLNRAMDIFKKENKEKDLNECNEKLKIIAPRFQDNITKENIFKVAKDFESNRDFKKARELYSIINEAQDSSLDEKIKASNANRMSFKVERNLSEFLSKTFDMEENLRELKNSNPEDAKYAEAWGDSIINYAKAVWTEHKPEIATKYLKEFLESNLGSNNQKANALWLLGSIEIEAKNNQKALKYFLQASLKKITDNSLLENVQWAIVWNQYLLKDYKSVSKTVQKYTKDGSINSPFANKLLFWKGVSLKKLNKEKEAIDLFELVYNNDPFSYYGLMSTTELDQAIEPILKSEILLTNSGDDLLDWLIGLEETSLSAKYLKEINGKFKTYNQREEAMALYLKTQWYQGGMNQITILPAKNKKNIVEKYIDVIYPTPYFDTINSMANKYQIPRELIFSIIRQESSFTPTERSWADAFGLMQMIPEKAIDLSKKYSIPYNDFSDLYKPEINIEMGAALLAELKKKNDSKFAQTVASYNASGAAIKTWERERFNGNYLEFIEMIPYEETRNYIKLVFRNFITYKRLMTKESFKINPNFFAEPF